MDPTQSRKVRGTRSRWWRYTLQWCCTFFSAFFGAAADEQLWALMLPQAHKHPYVEARRALPRVQRVTIPPDPSYN